MRSLLTALAFSVISISGSTCQAANAVDGELLSDAARPKRESEARALVSALRADLNDPDSLRVNLVLSNRPGTITCISYRAKNAYGGYIRQRYANVDGPLLSGDMQGLARCSEALIDMTYAIPQGIRG